jgi:hypothetical protein
VIALGPGANTKVNTSNGGLSETRLAHDVAAGPKMFKDSAGSNKTAAREKLLFRISLCIDTLAP